VAIYKCNGSGSQSGSVAFLDLGGWRKMYTISTYRKFGSSDTRLTEDDLVTFLPHFSDQGLTRHNSTSESNFDVGVRTESLEYVLSGDTHRAKSVQDYSKHTHQSLLFRGRHEIKLTWLLETTHCGEFGVDVQGVSITRQPVI
jgi:hypothetical protein